MKIYLQSTGNISPQKTFGHPAFLAELIEYTGNRLTCIEPDYKEIIDAKLIRRMSRIIRMGVAAAMECLQEAGIKVPDAIITGTAYGCLEDTGTFLTKMVQHNEEMLAPTAFIQSTHNTIGAQIALLLHCTQYNNAFVHRGFSFESALLDGMLLLMENAANNVLVGAIDELTDTSFAILNRLGLYKRIPASNLELFATHSKGTIAGEGASFFLLSNQPTGNDYAVVEAMTTFYKPAGLIETEERIAAFLQSQSISIHDIDIVITGKNGDAKTDEIYNQLQQSIFKNAVVIQYKNLCGEYPTSTAFAMWVAANILKAGNVPAILKPADATVINTKRILIYNNYYNIHHSLLLLSAC